MKSVHIFTTLMERNGKPRVWVQGAQLEEAGYEVGALYHRTKSAGQLTLELAESEDKSTRTVSRKKSGGLIVPLIDINNAELAEALPYEIGTQLVVTCRNGRIVIRVHPDVAAKKAREDRIKDRMARQHALRSAAFIEDGMATGALNAGLLGFGHTSFLQLGVVLAQDTMTEVEVPASLKACDFTKVVGDTSSLLSILSQKPAPADTLYIGDPARNAESDQAADFFFKIRAVEALNPAVVIMESAGNADSPLNIAAIQLLEALGYVIQNKTINERTVQLAVSEGLSDSDWTSLLTQGASGQTHTVSVSSAGRFMTSKHSQRMSNLMVALNSSKPMDSLSLFHGGGILSDAMHEGLSREGITTAVRVGVEIEDACLSSSLTNNSRIWSERATIMQGSISLARMVSTLPSCVIGEAGIPCVGASKSGRSRNKINSAEAHKKAGGLFYWTLRFFEEANLSVGVVENVTEYMNTHSMKVIRDTLAALGYTLSERILKGAQMGALEDRARMCCLFVDERLSRFFNLEGVQPLRRKEETLGMVLEQIPATSDMWKTYSYLADKEVRDIAAGKGFRRQLLTPEATEVGAIGAGYHKGRSTEPFIISPFQAGYSRLLTKYEHAAVKTIPACLISGLSSTLAHQILGNSVIHTAFESVSRMIGRGLARIKEEMSKEWIMLAA
ncbi:DNA cytosine methyltransferase [Marinobacterium stanieri]|uniref:Site-specific DNA-cytosine methylase n=1 Tax=Marinobacterium stanieri TaxID=49186 RepID=A0A1N6XL90_9GAMM|nr:DNA cytosine methyltransferase [Marinobacterium stanieri]SIR03092.1 Site-specific DNA-cytosine methylase [Marinobacterium stanieri]